VELLYDRGPEVAALFWFVPPEMFKFDEARQDHIRCLLPADPVLFLTFFAGVFRAAGEEPRLPVSWLLTEALVRVKKGLAGSHGPALHRLGIFDLADVAHLWHLSPRLAARVLGDFEANDERRRP
jgi:hypothetical protein